MGFIDVGPNLSFSYQDATMNVVTMNLNNLSYLNLINGLGTANQVVTSAGPLSPIFWATPVSNADVATAIANAFSNGVNTSITANNTLFVGSVTAANVVSNAQLQANLANYQTLAGEAANVVTLTSNNTLFVGSVTAANVVSNAQLIANLANYYLASNPFLFINSSSLSVPATYVQNTDSRVLSGNLQFSAANVTFGNSTVFATVNSTIFSQTANNALNLGGTAAASYQLNSTLAANVATMTANNSTNFAGQPQSFYANVTSPVITTTLEVGTAGNNVTINTTAILLGNSTVFSIVNSTIFSQTANNATNLGGVVAASYVQNTDSRTLSGNLTIAGTNTVISSNLTVSGTTITAGCTVINTTAVIIGNTTVNNSVNSTTYSGTSNNSTNFAGQGQAFYANVSAPIITTTLEVGAAGNNVTINTTAVIHGNSTIFSTINSTAFSQTANNATNFAGQGQAFYANVTSPAITTQVSIGSNVVLGTTQLSINGASSSTLAYVHGYTTAGAGVGVQCQSGVTPGATAQAILFLINSGTQVGLISTNSTATVYGTSSDRDLKEIMGDYDVEPLLELINKIKIHDARFIEDRTHRGPMLIADEVQKTHPHVVAGEFRAVKPVKVINPDIESPYEIMEQKYQTIDYGKFAVDLIGAIQVLTKKNQELEARINILERK